MNRDPENFESLRRLLAWKRHEQPPPGYFNDFSRRVMARIEAGEQGADPANWRTWLQRVWASLEARPAFAGAFGAAVCAFLVVGLLSSEDAQVMTYRPDPVTPQAALGELTAHPASDASATRAETWPVAGTNATQSLTALFSQSLISTEPVRVDFTLPGGR